MYKRQLLSKLEKRLIIAKYKINRISVEVNLASQTHQVPQVGCPQTAPVNSAKKVNIAPKGAMEIMNTLAILIRHIRYVTEAITIV